ncbi:TIGR02588 family protein [Geodermatophilus sp. DF01-2]|uniref:TIGR02588 family protein n=1 Tax=Geodermatophilus sp. DF01-2 TaxID=2559610 RepID=UPI0010736519|nr:TIGR02588 family protein [Geodermatophilus sp. DF01_2]TFV57733.1 TIGR02588 family protein [Geodermatophilus sp. DF01_2]
MTSSDHQRTDDHVPGGQDHGGDDQPDGGQGTPPAEKLVGVLGALLVAALLGFLIHQAVAVRESGPRLSVAVTSIEEAGEGYAVHFTAVNDGGATAEAVQISGTLRRQGEVVDQAVSQLAYLPPDSRHRGALIFSEDPRRGDLVVGPAGYRLP